MIKKFRNISSLGVFSVTFFGSFGYCRSHIKGGSSIVAGSSHVVSWRSAVGSSHGVNSSEGGILVAGCSHDVSWCSSGVSTT